MTDGEETEPGDATGREGNDGADGTGGNVVRRDRFSGGPARAFLSSLSADERIFEADLQVDRAHVVMLAEQGIVDDAEAAAILGALDGVEAAGHGALPAGEDVHEAIETAVIEGVERDGETLVAGVGPAGGKMHTARSRNDEVATCIRYRLREDLLGTVGTLVGARGRLLETAAGHTTTVMPGYTHLQSAQPTTVAHWMASYEGALARDTARLFDAYGRVDQSPLGAAAFAGTPFDVDRERTATLLGFDGVVENATDAVSARDFLVETAAGLAALATTTSGLAEDVVGFASRGYVDLDDDYASTSSIMPQKKNPDTLELARARSGDAAAALNGLLTTLKGLPRAYNRDLQRATGHVWDAVDDVPEAVEVATGAVATADWPADDLERAAGEGFSTATGVADLLAASGVPFRTAHEVVAAAAEEAAESGAEDATTGGPGHGGATPDGPAGRSDGTPDYETLAAAADGRLDEPLSAYVAREDVEAALDPARSVATRDSRGGPAPAAVEESLTRARERLEADREALAARRETLADARETLRAEVDGYV